MHYNIMPAVTWFGQEHRLFWLNWSYLTIPGFLGNAIFFTVFAFIIKTGNSFINLPKIPGAACSFTGAMA